MDLGDCLTASQLIANMRARNITLIPETCFSDSDWPSFNYHLFDFEKNFDPWGNYLWYLDNWTVCFYFIGFYLIAIFVGYHFMKSRPPFQLRVPLIVWNLTLAVFSIVATIRVLPQLFFMNNEFGFEGSLCIAGPRQHTLVIGFWITVFYKFKVLELGDTAFIILRKTPLMFLHYYHHITVLLYTWSNAAYPSPMQRYFFTTNLIMHSFVYSYFALKALRVNIPRQVNIIITSLQLLEMLFGIIITTSGYMVMSQNPDCCIYPLSTYLSGAVYASYFVLFLHFFIRSYIKNNGSLFDERGIIKKNV